MNPILIVRVVTGLLFIFDLTVGVGTLLFPDYYMTLMHGLIGDHFMLQRTGVVWFSFAVCELIACLFPKKFPEFILIAAILHLLDAPADIVYYRTSVTITNLGWWTLILSPIINIALGVSLIYLWREVIRSLQHGKKI